MGRSAFQPQKLYSEFASDVNDKVTVGQAGYDPNEGLQKHQVKLKKHFIAEAYKGNMTKARNE